MTRDRDHADHDHTHGPSLASSDARHIRPLTIAVVLIGGYFIVELIAGLTTGSLALLSDAGHMATDVIGLGLALAAMHLARRFEQRPDMGRHTFGLYRTEVLAAFVNALMLFAVAIWVLIEAVRRLFGDPEVLGIPMLVVAVLGLLVNLIALFILRDGASASINVEAASLEVFADSIGSVGVIVAALLLEVFGWTWVDPVIGALIGVWILPRTWRLGRRAVHILTESAPDHVDMDALRSDLASIGGVTDVHDLHVWTLTSSMEAASAHLVVDAAADTQRVLAAAQRVVSDGHRVAHGTLQIEHAQGNCHDLAW